jgi:hypothetical protein
VSWFSLSKSKGTNPVEIERSLQYFRDRGFDIDAFLDNLDVEEVLDTPLGHTKECLSPNEIAALVERDQISAARRVHVGECDECRQLIGIYKQASIDDWLAPDQIHIVRSDHIWIPEGGEFYLIVANRGKKGFLRDLDPDSVKVKGQISGEKCVIEELDPKPYEAREAVKLLFNSYNVRLPVRDKPVPCILRIEGKSERRDLNHKELVFVRIEQT